MADKQSMADKQLLAKILYTRENLDQKVIAQKVGVSEKTISNWVNTFNWKDLKNRLLLTKDEELGSLYRQLAALNKAINDNTSYGYPDTKQADVQIKLTSAIRNLETDLAISDLVESGMRFVRFVQRTGTFEQVQDFTELWHSFLQSEIKK